MRVWIKVLVSAWLFFFVSACGLPPIGSWVELLKIDPLDTDFNNAYVVVRLPDHIRPTVDAIDISTGIEVENGERFETVMGLKTGVPEEIQTFAARLVRPGDNVYAFALDEKSIREAEIIQEKIAEFKRLGIRGSFKVGYTANPEGMCYTSEVSLRDRMSVWLKTSEMSRMVPLVENKRLGEILISESSDLEPGQLIVPCE